MAITKFSNKDPSETILVTYDFSNLLNLPDEILMNSDWSVITSTGIDLNPANILTGAYALNRTSVSAYITGGINGNVYEIIVIVTTNKNQVLKMSGSINIKVQ